jgi:hypothetical protein
MHFRLTSLLLSLVKCGPDNFFWSFERVGLLGLGWAWYWDQTMNQVFELAGDLVPPKVAHDLMRLLAEGAGEDDEEADSLLRSSAVWHTPSMCLFWNHESLGHNACCLHHAQITTL